MFEARLTQGNIFKRILDAIKDVSSFRSVDDHEKKEDSYSVLLRAV